MDRPVKVMVVAGVAATLVGFFLPWATLDLREGKTEQQLAAGIRRSLSKTFKSNQRGSREPSWIRSQKGKGKPVIPTRVSGYDIPGLANREHVNVLTGLAELFTKKRARLGAKSYAVYLVPGLALLCGALLMTPGTKQPAVIGIALFCVAVSGGGTWIVLTKDTRTAYAVAVGSGLWLSLAGFAVLALAAAVRAWPDATLARRFLPG